MSKAGVGNRRYGGSGKPQSITEIGKKFDWKMLKFTGQTAPLVFKFETHDEIKEYLSGDKIQCLLCGLEFRSLSNHLRVAHTMGRIEYNDFYGIPRKYRLAGLSTRKKYRARALHELEDTATRNRLHEAAKKALAKAKTTPRTPLKPATKRFLKELNEKKFIATTNSRNFQANCGQCGKEFTMNYMQERKKAAGHGVRCKTCRPVKWKSRIRAYQPREKKDGKES